jgi:hypothetical protein
MREKVGYTMARPSWRWWIALDFCKHMGSSGAVVVVGDINGCIFCLVGRLGRSSRFRFIF